MRKAEMVRRLADETDLTQAKATEVVEMIFDEIKRALQHGESVILRGFGAFHVRDNHARIGRNPKTGQEAATTIGLPRSRGLPWDWPVLDIPLKSPLPLSADFA